MYAPLLLALLSPAPHTHASPQAPRARREVRLIMGTTVEVEALSLPDPGALEQAFAAMQRIDDLMSLWKPSELSHLNACGEAVVSADTAAVLALALELASASGGAFDPTVEPLVRARGGQGGVRHPLAPGDRERLLKVVGYRRIHLDPASRAVRLEPGTTLDLGGIAKGYAVDLALRVLRRRGAEAARVDLGESSLGIFGRRLRLLVRDPEDPSKPPWAAFTLAEAALASSGNDQRPGHILDPRSGRPAEGILAATVVARSGAEADALSTAVFVLGAGDGLALLTRRAAAGLVLERRRGARLIRTTPGFSRRFDLDAAPGVRVEE